MHDIKLILFYLASLSYILIAGRVDAESLQLKNHPRLWVGEEDIAVLKKKFDSPTLQNSVSKVIKDADWLLTSKLINENDGNTYQSKTRAIASRLKNLTLAWVITEKSEYRDAAMLNLKNMMGWNQISCEARLGMPHEPLKYFCLSAGEHSADIALMYDLFKADITAEEKKVFDDVINRFYMKAALRAKEHKPWWANKEWSNWNAVCSGGIGLLALAFYEDHPRAKELLPFVEESLSHYFKSYIKNGGGNHEGTGYWNYGMHYAIRYLLSWERATGKKHPAFNIKELGQSLHFPVDFTRISFGDNDGWHPGGFYFMMADRMNQKEPSLRAAKYIYGSSLKPNNAIKINTKKNKKAPKPKTIFSMLMLLIGYMQQGTFQVKTL